MLARALAVVCLFAVTSCSRRDTEPQRDPNLISAKTATVALPTRTADGGIAAAPGELTWTAPASWQKVWSPSPMRKATYKVARAAGDTEDAEVSVAQAGGSVDANIERWSSQFAGANATRTERTVGATKVTMVELHGAFTNTMAANGPATKPGWALLGAIAGDGVDNTFFKLVGPEKTVAAAKSDFEKMIDSVRPLQGG